MIAVYSGCGCHTTTISVFGREHRCFSHVIEQKGEDEAKMSQQTMFMIRIEGTSFKMGIYVHKSPESQRGVRSQHHHMQ